DFDDSTWGYVSLAPVLPVKMEAQQIPPIRITRKIKPRKMTKLSPKRYIFDMGENFSGVCKIKVKGERGTVVKIRHSELMNTNKDSIDQGNVSFYFRPDSIHPTAFTDIFILKGGGEYETFQPSFTYHGFQYVEVEADNPIALELNDLEGQFLHTDLR